MSTAQPRQQQSAPAQRSRMTLDALVRGKQQAPARVVIYGPEGIGKSTFGANAPGAIFLGAEDGTAQLDVTRFPTPENWTEALDAIRTLTTDAHEFRTLVVDTLDWLEPVLWRHICERDKKRDIEEYGFGKGYQAALDEWRVFLSALDRLRMKRGMNVVLIAHSHVKSFKNPEGDDFDRYELKLHLKASGLIKEWSDAVLFAAFETFAVTDSKTKRTRGVSSGARLLNTERTAAFDAKNRYGLPPTIPISWDEFAAGMDAQQPASADVLLAQLREQAKRLAPPQQQTLKGMVERAAGDAQKLALALDWAGAKVITTTQQESN